MTASSPDKIQETPARRHRAYELVQYIFSCIRQKKEDSDDSLPGEIELCRKFSVSRGMAQRTIENMLKGGYIIRKPKRRGIFLNPAMRGKLPLAVGIAIGGSINNTMEGGAASALAGFCRYITKNVSQTQYFKYLSCEEIGDIENELAMQGLDALVWITPGESCKSVVDSLTENRFPAAVIFSPYIRSYADFPRKNSFIFDYEKYGEEFAQALLQKGCKSPILYGLPGVAFATIEKVFAEKGYRIPEANLIKEEIEFPDHAMKRVMEGKADSIVAKGSFMRYNSVIRQLKAHPGFEKTPLFLDCDHVTENYRKENPELDILFIDKVTIDDRLFKCGEKAAMKLMELLRKPGSTFENKKFY